MRIITRTVWALSLVSLFTDIASEMLYPVMPIYLQSIHFSVLFIGVLEGIAEATAGLSKGYFGKLSDNMGRRLPFVRLGYALSALSKPVMALFTFPAWVLGARTLDRLGKGIRTGARDALLSSEATAGTKGRVFGFHRGMDTLGAVLGPLLAIAFLYFYPGQYRMLFYLAFLPGVAAIGFTFLLKEKDNTQKVNTHQTRFTDFLKYWRVAPVEYRKLVAGLVVFAMFNSSDIFLLLKCREAGINDMLCIGIYVFYNFFYALAAYPLGAIGDKIGLRKMFVAGMLLFSATYAGMAFSGSVYTFFALFAIYGVYMAATEGITKAWISNITDKADTATAIGAYSSFQSIASLIASTIAGAVWLKFGATATFLLTAIVGVLAAIYFSTLADKLRK